MLKMNRRIVYSLLWQEHTNSPNTLPVNQISHLVSKESLMSIIVLFFVNKISERSSALSYVTFGTSGEKNIVFKLMRLYFALLLVPQWRCISSFVFYIAILFMFVGLNILGEMNSCNEMNWFGTASRIQSLYLYFIKIVPFWLWNIRF